MATDLRYFDLIVPCGIAGRKATSLEKILKRTVTRQAVLPALAQNFGAVFGLEMRGMSRGELLARLDAGEFPGDASQESAESVGAVS